MNLPFFKFKHKQKKKFLSAPDKFSEKFNCIIDEEKISLFLKLFTGRGRCFLQNYGKIKNQEEKDGLLFCSNEWVRGICEKPKIKCAECFKPIF